MFFFLCKSLSEREYIFGITITVLKIPQNNDNRRRHLEFYFHTGIKKLVSVLPSFARSQFKFRFRHQFRIPDSGFPLFHTSLEKRPSTKQFASKFLLTRSILDVSGKIGSRSSFSGPIFADKKVIDCARRFIQFVVYSMRNPVVYRTAKKVVFC